MKKYSLPKEFGEKWVKALRATELKQGFGKYHDMVNDCYCAMGVGLVVNNVLLDKHGRNTIGNDPLMDCRPIQDNDDSSLWLSIYKLNDKQRKSFSEIADLIVENVEFI